MRRPARTQHRHLAASALAVLVLLGAAAALYAAWPASSSKAGYGVPASRPGQPAAVSAGSPEPVTAGNQEPVSAENQQLPTGPAALKPRNPSHVTAWGSGPGGATLAALSTHVSSALMAHGPGRFVRMKQACIGLAADVATASGQPPIPDTALESRYRLALTSFAAGAADCRAAISARLEGDEDNVITTNAPLLAKAISELDAGVRDLYQATGKIATPRKA